MTSITSSSCCKMNKSVSVVLGSKMIYVTLLKQILDQKKKITWHNFFLCFYRTQKHKGRKGRNKQVNKYCDWTNKQKAIYLPLYQIQNIDYRNDTKQQCTHTTFLVSDIKRKVTLETNTFRFFFFFFSDQATVVRAIHIACIPSVLKT